MASTSPLALPRFRLLLDQGFPKPPGFAIEAVDATVQVDHLVDFNPQLSQVKTPDWVIYCRAAEAGYAALVTRDRAQLDLLVEMYTLSRLSDFTVITWRKPIEDPIREWGQLLAYLPELKRRLGKERPKAILLPAPRLGVENMFDPRVTLGLEARTQGVSLPEAKAAARRQMRDWLEVMGEDPSRFDAVLGW